jgi:putative inorganic carbon (HCO3(-)) transporter
MMDIIQNSYVINFINKIDLSNKDKVFETVAHSKFSQVLQAPLKLLHPPLSRLAENSLIARYIDHLILTNIVILLIALTFAPTIFQGVLVASGLMLTLFKWLFIAEEGHNFTLFDIPVAAYIGVALISVAFSTYFMPSLKGFAKLMTYFASYVVFTNIFKGSSTRVYFILAVVAITGGLEAMYGILQKFSGVEALATWQDPDSIMAGRKMSRVYGSLDPFNPNLLAGYLLPVLPIAFGMGCISWLKKSWVWSIPFFILSGATLLTIIFTGSRGAYIGVALMGLFIYFAAGHLIWHSFNNYKYSKYLKLFWVLAGLAGVGAIIAAIFAVPALHDRIMSIFTLRGNSSNSFRMNVYIASWNMFTDNWLIGIGPGNTTFRLVYGFYMMTGFDALGTYSVPLEIMVEMGIIGLLIFFWLILVIFSNAVKLYNSSNLLEVKLLILTILAAFAGIAGQGVFDTIWYRPQVHIIFWLLVAILSCMVSKKVYFKAGTGNEKS